jgi:predicted transcriptional regulator
MAKESPTAMPRLHELEADVMDVIWRRGSANVRDVLDALNARGTRERAYTTVMTIMDRLYRKDVLERTKAGRRYVYSPRTSREEYLDGRARVEVQALVARYGDVALAHFSRAVQCLGPDRRASLKRLSLGA